MKVKLEASQCRANVLEQDLKVSLARSDQAVEHWFSFDRIKHSDELVRFYTGLPNVNMFNVVYSFCEDCVDGLVTWKGARTENAESTTSEKKKHALSPIDELFSTLMKLRLDCPYVDLSMRFHIGKATVSKIRL